MISRLTLLLLNGITLHTVIIQRYHSSHCYYSIISLLALLLCNDITPHFFIIQWYHSSLLLFNDITHHAVIIPRYFIVKSCYKWNNFETQASSLLYGMPVKNLYTLEHTFYQCDSLLKKFSTGLILVYFIKLLLELRFRYLYINMALSLDIIIHDLIKINF